MTFATGRSASAAAIARPMPRFAPVTRQVAPCRSMLSFNTHAGPSSIIADHLGFRTDGGRELVGTGQQPENRSKDLAGHAGAGLQGPPPGRGLHALPRACADPQARLGLRRRALPHDALRDRRVPRPGHPRGPHSARGAADPGAQPLLVHGPLLRRDVHPPPGAVHGQVAALQAPDAVCLHARRGVSRAPRPRRPGGVHHRRVDPRPRRLRGHVLRGRALTDR